LELISSQESETDDHQGFVDNHQKVDSGTNSSSCVVGGALVLEESQGDNDAHTEEDETSEDSKDSVEDMHAIPAQDFSEVRMDVISSVILDTCYNGDEIVQEGQVEDGNKQSSNIFKDHDGPVERELLS